MLKKQKKISLGEENPSVIIENTRVGAAIMKNVILSI